MNNKIILHNIIEKNGNCGEFLYNIGKGFLLMKEERCSFTLLDGSIATCEICFPLIKRNTFIPREEIQTYRIKEAKRILNNSELDEVIDDVLLTNKKKQQ